MHEHGNKHNLPFGDCIYNNVIFNAGRGTSFQKVSTRIIPCMQIPRENFNHSDVRRTWFLISPSFSSQSTLDRRLPFPEPRTIPPRSISPSGRARTGTAERIVHGYPLVPSEIRHERFVPRVCQRARENATFRERSRQRDAYLRASRVSLSLSLSVSINVRARTTGRDVTL